MGFDAHKNLAYSTVATAPSPASSGTSLVVQAGEGAKFPAPPFNVTIWPVGAQPNPSNSEIARCTAVATDTLTLVRATTTESPAVGPRSVIIGDQIAETITAKVLVDIENMLATEVALADGATPALDASLGSTFRLAAAGDRTIGIPTNPRAGQKIIIEHYASGGARTLALNSGTGGFRFGSDVTGLTVTASGKTDYIGCHYNTTDNKWDVLAVVKGY